MDYELEITNTTGVPSEVISIPVDEGDRIGENDVILRLDSGEVLAPIYGRVKEMKVYVKAKGKEIKKMYFFYTTCPACAKVYGKNYTVILAEV